MPSNNNFYTLSRVDDPTILFGGFEGGVTPLFMTHPNRSKTTPPKSVIRTHLYIYIIYARFTTYFALLLMMGSYGKKMRVFAGFLHPVFDRFWAILSILGLFLMFFGRF